MNNVVHFELPADDIKKTQDFYAKTFGWKFKPWSEEYVQVIATEADSMGRSTKPGTINGGIQKRSDRAKAPTVVIQVDSINEAIKNIQANGGKIVISKEELAGEGSYAQFDDPEGNRVGLFEMKK